MILERLELSRFRNYEALALEVQPGLNLLVGENAQGKTSLLEAVYLLGTSRSFRAAQDAELVSWGGDSSRVHARLRRDDGVPRELDIRWSRADRGRLSREVLRNRLPVRRLSDFLGEVPLALFVPGDLALVQGGPEGRRRYLDLLLCKLYPAYLGALARMQQVLRQRNELLRRKPPPSPSDMEPWDRQLAATAVVVSARREAAATELGREADAFFRHLSDAPAELSMAYRASGPASEDEFLAELGARRREELARGTSLLGPHRDDLDLRLDGRSLRRFGSQGQQRSAALALRLAEGRFLGAVSGEGALVLLDDCFSELDPGRRGRLLELLREWRQVFVTTTCLPETPPAGSSILEVVAGRVRPI